MDGILTVGFFLFATAFGLLTLTLWIRFALRFLHVSTLNPISQVILKLTNPLVQPLNYMLKNMHIKRYDIPCAITLTMVVLLKFSLIGLIFFPGIFPWTMLVFYTLADMIVQPLNIFFYAIIIRVIMSWINPHWRNPVGDLIIIITEPVLSFTRKYIPTIANFDFSPILILIIIKSITLFIGASLPFNLVS